MWLLLTVIKSDPLPLNQRQKLHYDDFTAVVCLLADNIVQFICDARKVLLDGGAHRSRIQGVLAVLFNFIGDNLVGWIDLPIERLTALADDQTDD